MFTSLRGRLWLTYILVIGGVLVIAGTLLAWYLLRNPMQARQAFQRLQLIATIVQQRELPPPNAAPAAWVAATRRIDELFDVRAAVLRPDGTPLADSRGGAASPIPLDKLFLRDPSGLANLEYRDQNGKAWVYTTRPLPEGNILVLAVPRPRVTLRQLLSDDFLRPFWQAGLVALALAFLLGYWVSRWTTAPLRRISQAAQAVAAGANPSPAGTQPVPLEGPSEVQELAGAFNEMNARLQASQQSQRDFVANVSHDLKTPLTSIQGFAQALLDGTASSPQQIQQSAQVIFDEAGRMHRLVLSLLELAQLDSGMARLERTPVELAALLRSIAAKLEPQAAQFQVKLNVEIGALPGFIGDGDRLAQVFTNLVDNAIQYTPAGGTITLRAGQVGDQVEIAVVDSGPGIPPEDLQRIFERFYQVDKARRGGGGRGLGLGLAIAREIVQAHGGSIAAHNNPQQGSTFVVKLPLARPDDSTVVRRRRN